VSRVFLSHSSVNSAEAIAIRDWLRTQGWDDVFLDLDPERGLRPGERWQAALKSAVDRCQMVIFIVSPAWVTSKWCLAEFLLAKTLNKRIFGVIVEPTEPASLPAEMTTEWQITDLTLGVRDYQATVTTASRENPVPISFSSEGLRRLRIGIHQVGLDAKFFIWPPAHDPNRSPYRGLRPLEADDAGIFFGRDAPIIAALDQLRGLREAAPPRLLVILGASGAGKSSFLRAGLLPRLARDDRHFRVLPIVRPGRALITGETGLLRSLETALEAAGHKIARADLREVIAAGGDSLRTLVRALVGEASVGSGGDQVPNPPTLILAVDQAEELFTAEAQTETLRFLSLIRELLTVDSPALIAIFTIRSDNYERLQEANELDGIRKLPFDLGPMPKFCYADVVRGPLRRLAGTSREIEIDDKLVDEILADVEAGGAKDALPLLAFSLERLYQEYGGSKRLTTEQYVKLGRVKGSIEAAVERAFEASDADPRIPKDRGARLTLLRRGLIPWLAGIDPDSKAPRRRVARLSEIPLEARPLIDAFVDQRLLSTDIAKESNEKTIEPAHEALLRQWGLLQGWLVEDFALLSILDGVKRASRDWAANGRQAAWLTHRTERLKAAEALDARPDLSRNLEPTELDYLKACRAAESAARARARRAKALVSALMTLLVIGLVGWFEQERLKQDYEWYTKVYPFRLNPAKERALVRGETFHECEEICPEMVFIPGGRFTMGSNDRDETPPHAVTLQPFAASETEITFDQWDACVAAGGCTSRGADNNWGRGKRPKIILTWREAKEYTKWLAMLTQQPYRLLSESEWEYLAANQETSLFEENDSMQARMAFLKALSEHAWWNENAKGTTQEVRKLKPTPFGLYDIFGNVWELVEDAYADNYEGAPDDGTARPGPDGSSRVARGGSWLNSFSYLKSTARLKVEEQEPSNVIGFRVARSLPARGSETTAAP
jgi:formylglycine-generating enzyme required for sulfatase activity